MRIVPFVMTGASIVGWREGEAIVLAVHGAFDGASAWALRIRMDELEAGRYVVDLANAEEACEFAACLLSSWQRQHAGVALSFRTGSLEQARLLAAYGLEVEPDAVQPVALAVLGVAAAVPVAEEDEPSPSSGAGPLAESSGACA